MWWALTAQAGNASLDIPVAAAEAALRVVLRVPEHEFSARAFAPENFLLQFESQATRDRVLRAGRVPVGTTQLIFKPWTRVTTATADTLFFRIKLEIVGIPPHAWHLSFAYELLSAYGWIKCLDPETESLPTSLASG